MKTLLNAALGKPQKKIPSWFMRQAGRYLPEYRELRKSHPTLEMFQTPSIAAEVTLQPLRRFNLDGAILYADILLIPDALGAGLSFVTGEGPKFSKPIRCPRDLTALRYSEDTQKILSDLSYVAESIERVVPKLDSHVTMLGFAGSPFTVASYMIEGESGTKTDFSETRKMLAKSPEIFHGLMELLTRITIGYLNMQIDAGVEVIQLFESWSGVLSANQYQEFCRPYLNQITAAIKPRVPVIHYFGKTAHLLDDILGADVLPNVLSVDHHMSLKEVSEKIGHKSIALQGNLSPETLFESHEKIQLELEECLKIGRAHKHGYIFNLGHGIRKETSVENMQFISDILTKINTSHSDIEFTENFERT